MSIPCAVLSLVLFSTTSGLHVLDIVDHFINQFGILLVAVVSMLVVAWALRALPLLQNHLNRNGSFKLGTTWRVLISVVAPIALAYVLFDGLVTDIETPYGDFPGWMLGVFGWGAAGAVIVFGFLATLLPWRKDTPMDVTGDEEVQE